MKRLLPFVAFAAALDALAITFYVDTLHMPRAAYQLPRILIVLVILLSLLMIAEQFWKLRSEGAVPEKQDDLDAVLDAGPAGEEETPESRRSRLARIIFFVGTLSAYVLTIKPLGYFVATPLFLLGTLGFLRSTTPARALAIAVGFTGFVYLLFVLFLNLPVPMGLMEFE